MPLYKQAQATPSHPEYQQQRLGNGHVDFSVTVQSELFEAGTEYGNRFKHGFGYGDNSEENSGGITCIADF